MAARDRAVYVVHGAGLRYRSQFLRLGEGLRAPALDPQRPDLLVTRILSEKASKSQASADGLWTYQELAAVQWVDVIATRSTRPRPASTHNLSAYTVDLE